MHPARVDVSARTVSQLKLALALDFLAHFTVKTFAAEPQKNLDERKKPLAWRNKPCCHEERYGLLDRASYLREHVVGIRTNQANGANYNYQNDSQHHCIFSDVLASFV